MLCDSPGQPSSKTRQLRPAGNCNPPSRPNPGIGEWNQKLEISFEIGLLKSLLKRATPCPRYLYLLLWRVLGSSQAFVAG